MSKIINVTESLRRNGAEQICKPKCLTGRKFMSLSLWGRILLFFMLANQN